MGIKLLINQVLRASGHPSWRGWTPDPGAQSERFPTTAEFLSRHQPTPNHTLNTALDLGCGKTPRNPFGAIRSQGIDLVAHESEDIIACDLSTSGIPFAANSFDAITAFDFIEHIPRVAVTDRGTRFPFIDLMSEIFRVLKPEGFFFSSTPAYPCKEAFQDPTHINIITEDTFPLYFCNETWARIYGFQGSFLFIAQEWCRPSLLTLIQKPKGNPGNTDTVQTS